MRGMTEWKEKKWYWVACFLFGFLGMLVVLVIGSFLFPEVPLVRSLFSIIAMSFSILLGACLTSRVWKRRFETRILRMAYVAGGVVLGMFLWSFIIIPLALVYDFPGEGTIVILLLFVLMVIGALIMDVIGKRREYQPLLYEEKPMHFRCSECGHTFVVSRLRLLFTRRFRGYATPHPNLPSPWPDPTTVPKVAYYLKCPKYGKKSWLTPII